MVQMQLGFRRFIVNFRDAGNAFNRPTHRRQLGGIIDINMRDLVIGDGERVARAGIQQFAAQFDANL
jgi:N-dimethylarginine dimethylaminohydrolase